MNDAVGSHDFVKQSSATIVDHFTRNTPDVKAAIAAATGAKSEGELEQHRTDLLASFTEVRNKAAERFRNRIPTMLLVSTSWVYIKACFPTFLPTFRSFKVTEIATLFG